MRIDYGKKGYKIAIIALIFALLAISISGQVGTNGSNGTNGTSSIMGTLTFALHNTSSGISTYLNMNSVIVADVPKTYRYINSTANGDTAIVSFLSPSLNLTLIPAGAILVHIDASKVDGANHDDSLWYDVGLVNSTGQNYSSIGISAPSTQLITSSEMAFDLNGVMLQKIINTTDRLMLIVYVHQIGSGTLPDVTVYMDDLTLSRLTIPAIPIDLTSLISNVGNNTANIDLKVNKSGDTMTGTLNTTIINNSVFGITMQNITHATASGGTMTTDGLYTVHTFTSNGTFVPPANMSIEYLIIAGGGGGGHAYSGTREAGGGGAGGVIIGNTTVINATSYNIIIGSGGASETNGMNSSFNNTIAIGGGYGGGVASPTGKNGGSGGGGGGGQVGGIGIIGQGKNGGTSTSSGWGAGGGGNGSIGLDGNANQGGSGGNGTVYSISGVSICYAGGGGGGAGVSTSNATCGGGISGKSPSTTGQAGTPNTGGGGGAGGSSGGIGGTGGSGIVIIRYLTADADGFYITNWCLKVGSNGALYTTPGAC